MAYDSDEWIDIEKELKGKKGDDTDEDEIEEEED